MAKTSLEVIAVTGLWTEHTSAEIWASRKYSSLAEIVGIEESFTRKYSSLAEK